jgi:hypothetical protein
MKTATQINFELYRKQTLSYKCKYLFRLEGNELNIRNSINLRNTEFLHIVLELFSDQFDNTIVFNMHSEYVFT